MTKIITLTHGDYAPTFYIEVESASLAFIRLVKVRSMWEEYDNPDDPDLPITESRIAQAQKLLAEHAAIVLKNPA